MPEARPGGSPAPDDPAGDHAPTSSGDATGNSAGTTRGDAAGGGERTSPGDAGGSTSTAGTATPTAGCRECRAPTVEGQRYCLSCGALLGDRRLDPLAHLHTRGGTVPPPPASPSPAPRAVPLAAAATAILVAGVSGMLVTGGDEGARAAVVTRPTLAAAPVPAPASAKPEKAPADDDGGDDETSEPADTSAAEEPAADDTAPVEEAAVDDTAAEDAPVDDTSADTEEKTEDDTDTEESAITPHVWLLALDGPKAQEAVERIAEQGVSLTGIKPLAGETAVNATGLVTGVRPVPAGAASPEVTPSLPELLKTAGQSWRAYVDAQPNGTAALPGACSAPPVGDAAAAALASRLPFGRIAALSAKHACGKGVASLETLSNDVSAGDTIPDFSYAALGGCAPPERTAVALPDQVSDTVTAITESTEFQENGLLIVTTVGAADPCPATPSDPATPAPAPPLAADGTLAPVPTVVLRADAKAGTKVDTPADQLALTRLAATTLGVDPPGASGADDVPALELPAAGG